MKLIDIFNACRTKYLDLFEETREHIEKDTTEKVPTEIGSHVEGVEELYKQQYRFDFYHPEKNIGIDVNPSPYFEHKPFNAKWEKLSINGSQVHWDNIVLEIDIDLRGSDKFEKWFDHWYDAQEQRHAAWQRYHSVIHSAIVAENRVSVDFGTAPGHALLELIELVKNAGGRSVHILDTRTVANDADGGTPI